MTGRCSKCKEMCEAGKVPGWINEADYPFFTAKYESNCCGAPLIEDGEPESDE